MLETSGTLFLRPLKHFHMDVGHLVSLVPSTIRHCHIETSGSEQNGRVSEWHVGIKLNARCLLLLLHAGIISKKQTLLYK